MRREELPRQHAGGASKKAGEAAAKSARDAGCKKACAAGFEENAPAPAAVNASAALSLGIDLGVSADLSASGIAIRDQFICAAEVLALRECARARELRGDFAPARVGRQGVEQRRNDIRGDFTCWLREPLRPPESALLERLEQLRRQLNREAFLGLFELELHYARYPAGAAYSRHVDQPMGSTQRKLSLVLYLNTDWQCGDGGQCRSGGQRGDRPQCRHQNVSRVPGMR